MPRPPRPPGKKALRAVAAVRRSFRAYAGIVRAVAADLQRLQEGLPLPPEQVLDRLWERGYDSKLYPAVETRDAAEAVVRRLCHAAWLLERGSAGLGDLGDEEKKSGRDPGAEGYPPEPLAADRDPVAAARRELLAGAVVVRGLASSFQAIRSRLGRRAQNPRLSARTRRAASVLAARLRDLIAKDLEPAGAKLGSAAVARFAGRRRLTRTSR